MLAGMEKMIGHMRLAVPPPQEIFNPAAKNFRGVRHLRALRPKHKCVRSGGPRAHKRW